MSRFYKPDEVKYRVAMLDYGFKQNIVQSLLKRGCEVTVFPANTTVEQINAFDPDGIMLTNGPGDPKDCTYAIDTIRGIMGTRPMFGICLGHQLMALANGADTGKAQIWAPRRQPSR